MQADKETPAAPLCSTLRRRTFWERHGSWVLLSIVAASCLGIGLHIGAQVTSSQVTSSQLTTLNLQHTAEMQRMQLRHQEETAKLTSQLAEAVRQAACAAKISAGGACQSDPQTEP